MGYSRFPTKGFVIIISLEERFIVIHIRQINPSVIPCKQVKELTHLIRYYYTATLMYDALNKIWVTWIYHKVNLVRFFMLFIIPKGSVAILGLLEEQPPTSTRIPRIITTIIILFNDICFKIITSSHN